MVIAFMPVSPSMERKAVNDAKAHSVVMTNIATVTMINVKGEDAPCDPAILIEFFSFINFTKIRPIQLF